MHIVLLRGCNSYILSALFDDSNLPTCKSVIEAIRQAFFYSFIRIVYHY